MIRTYVVSGVRVYRDALSEALDRTARVHVVGTAVHPSEAIAGVRATSPEVALLDEPGADGQAWVHELVASAPGLHVLMLGTRDGEAEADADVVAWAEAGASGFLSRDACLEAVVAAIEAVVRGEAICSARAAAILLQRIAIGRAGASQPPLTARLTPRESEILGFVGKGMSNQQIARRLYIALPTVKNHIHNILEKLGVHTRLEALWEIRSRGFTLHDEPGPEGRLRLHAVPVSSWVSGEHGTELLVRSVSG